MNGRYDIRELSEVEMIAQHPLILQLSPEITQKEYGRMLNEMLKGGYRMVGVFVRKDSFGEAKKCIGISGFWMGTKLYSDKYIEPDNVVIDKEYRSKGVGKLLIDWLIEEGKRSGCKTVMLDAYVENFSGHKFYWREGFIARGFHFLKKI